MKTFVVLVAIALMAHQTKQDCCPEVDGVKSAINYLHLFKSQADSDFNFYDITTTVELVSQVEEDYPVGATTFTHKQLQTVLRVTVDGQPERVFYYMQEALFNLNGSLDKIVKFTRVRRKEGFDETNVVAYANAFFNPTTTIAAFAVVPCCLMKMEYIYFYYLFSNYYTDGRGNSLTC